ncbi:MAG: hypothetical protein IIU28_01460 [Lachnospiraceae bacterium]|nr:hypothetical protein [Lachnospiraceae bacterium]
MGDRSETNDNNLDLSVPLGYREFTTDNSIIVDEPSICEWSSNEQIYDLHHEALEKMNYSVAPFSESDVNDRFRILERKIITEMGRCGINADPGSAAVFFREYLMGIKGYSVQEALSIDASVENMLSEMDACLSWLSKINRDEVGASLLGTIVGKSLTQLLNFKFRGPVLSRPEDVRWSLKEFLGFRQIALDISSDFTSAYTSVKLDSNEVDSGIREAFLEAAGGSKQFEDSVRILLSVAQGFYFMLDNFNKRENSPAQRALAVRQYMDMYNGMVVDPLESYAGGQIFEEILGLKNRLDAICYYGVGNSYVDSYGLKRINALDRMGRDYLHGDIEFPEELEKERLRLKKDGRENIQDSQNRTLMTVVARIFNDSVEKYRSQLDFLDTTEDADLTKDQLRMAGFIFSNQFYYLYHQQMAEVMQERGVKEFDLITIDGKSVRESMGQSLAALDEKKQEALMKVKVLRAMFSKDQEVSIGIYGQTPEGYELVHIPYTKSTAYLGSQIFSTVGNDTLSRAQDNVVACLNAVEQRRIDKKQIPGVELASYYMIKDIFGYDLIRQLDRMGGSPFDYITVNTEPFMDVASEFTIDGEVVEDSLVDLGMVMTVLRVDPNNDIVIDLPLLQEGEVECDTGIHIHVELNPIDIQMNLLAGAKNTMRQAISRYRTDLYDQLLALQSKKHAINPDSGEYVILRDRTLEMVQLASKIVYKGRYNATDMKAIRDQLQLVHEGAKGYITRKMEQSSGHGLPGSLRRVRLEAAENIARLTLPPQVLEARSYEEMAGEMAGALSEVNHETREKRINRALKNKKL